MVDDEELRRRLAILRQKFSEGKISIAAHLAEGFKESLGKVRYGSDGEVDLSTVDARVRSMAMMAAVMSDRDDMKAAASLAEIQNAYFERITAMFEQPHKFMREHKADPHTLSWALHKDSQHVEENYPLIEPFVTELSEFWSSVSEPTRYHLQDMQALKGVFGGDLFPSYQRNIASTAGLYLDTIILTDPFMNSMDLFSKWPKHDAVRMFIKHGLQLMNYRELALADVGHPIVAILPFESSHDDTYRKILFDAAGIKALQHAEALFGRKYSTVEELHEFLATFSDAEQIGAALADRSRLLFDTDWTGDPASQISRAMEEFGPIIGDHPGNIIFSQCFGRMSQATDVSWKSSSLGGVPLIDAPTSWQYFSWSLEYGAERDAANNTPLHISKGMQRLAETDMQWLGNIPADALIDMRKQGALDEIRSILSNGVDQVVSINPDNFFRSADKIYDNLEIAFSDHQKKIRDLTSKKWRFAGRDIGSWIVAGSIEVAAAVIGTPAFGLASIAVSQLTDAPKLKDIPKMAADLKEERVELSKSAAGLLFRHRH